MVQFDAPACEKVPAAQLAHAVGEVAPVSGWYVPAAHSAGACPLPGQYEPGGHSTVLDEDPAGQ